MDRFQLMALVVAFMLFLLALMALGWRNRKRRQSALPQPRRVVGATGVERARSEVFYVATTAAGEPLERIAIGGLGFRARASISATDLGVVLEIPGQDAFWLPAGEIVGVDRATWTIDRVVETDGLVLLAWQLVADSGDATRVDTYLRFDTPTDAARFMDAVTELLDSVPTPSAQGGTA